MFGLVVWLVVGCGQVVEGTAERVSGQEGLFDPCADIPASAIESVGLDPTPDVIDVLGAQITGQRSCGWNASWYSLAIYSTVYEIDEIRSNEKFSRASDVQVGGRAGIEFSFVSDINYENCFVALRTIQGSIWVSIIKMVSKEMVEPTCPLALKNAEALLEYLPN
ncbi:hypothetical protein ABH922_003479 [Rhodococcus sp. 27YEA15]|uniref:DUF3558 domain-containing protein n=1 Tax=Rhodococcus sp. 27YEA15 TaxID=3156259 RepID=UPI003C7BAB53